MRLCANLGAFHLGVEAHRRCLLVDSVDLAAFLDEHDGFGEIVPHHVKCIDYVLVIHCFCTSICFY